MSQVLSCRQPDFHRSYLEIQISPAGKKPHHSLGSGANPLISSAGISKGGNNIDFKWTAPEGWTEKAGSGIRSATFLIGDKGDIAECAIVQLPDSGGGLAGNVKRWMKQLNYIIPSERYLHAFLSRQQRFKTAGGLNGTLIDMTGLLTGDITSRESVMAAVIPLREQTVFITMFGQKKPLQKNRHKLLSLGRSLHTAD